MPSVFAKYQAHNYPHRFAGTLHVQVLAGGVPSDPRVAEAWLRSKLADPDDLIREKVAELMIARGITAEQAAAELDMLKHLNGFLRDPELGLYLGGYQLKAALKEAASVAMAADKLAARGWGKTNKGVLGWVAEHIFVVEDRLYLGRMEPDDVSQRFVHTWRGDGIQYIEYVRDAKVDFTVETDHPFTDEQWAAIWTTGERQGIGAARSQGFGRYDVVRWDRVEG